MEEEFTTLYENDNFLATCRTEYLNDKQIWVRIKQKNDLGVLCIITIRYFSNKGEVEEFCKSLKLLPIKDERDKGYYCLDCGEFSPECIMVFDDIALNREDKFVMVKQHYDGCRGWD